MDTGVWEKETAMKSRWITAVSLALVLLTCGSVASALSYSNTLHAGADGGLTATGSWSSSDTKMFYDVSHNQDTGLWTYQYVLTIPNTKATPGISNLELELSPTFTEGNLKSGSTAYSELGNLAANNGNLGLAEDIFGIKYETGDVPSYAFSIVSDREPIWVDFAAKGGQQFVRNTGFGVADTDPLLLPYTATVLDHILGPDTRVGGHETPVPEPLTLVGVLMAGSVAGAYLRRRRA